MPLPTPPSAELRPERVVQMLPKTKEQIDSTKAYLEFFKQELKFWQADLQQKKTEGGYYLEWLSWLEPPIYSESSALLFRELLLHDLPALSKRIEDKIGGLDKDSPNLRSLLALQKSFQSFCRRYDQLRMGVLSKIEIGGNFTIF